MAILRDKHNHSTDLLLPNLNAALDGGCPFRCHLQPLRLAHPIDLPRLNGLPVNRPVHRHVHPRDRHRHPTVAHFRVPPSRCVRQLRAERHLLLLAVQDGRHQQPSGQRHQPGQGRRLKQRDLLTEEPTDHYREHSGVDVHELEAHDAGVGHCAAVWAGHHRQ